MNEIVTNTYYRRWIGELKQQIRSSQIKAALSVNSQMIMLYWDMGKQIVEKQATAKWGSGFIKQLSKDLQEEFPDMTGFSDDNLNRMKQFYKFYSKVSFLEQVVPKNEISDSSIVAQVVPQLQNTVNQQVIKTAQVVRNIKEPKSEFVKQVVSQLQITESQTTTNSAQVVRNFLTVPWGHHILILRKCKDTAQALFYIQKTLENNWSRAVLEYQIETNLYGRQGKAVTNFALTLPQPESDLANEMMKEPFNFDFIRLSAKAKETDLEKALVNHIAQFLPELGIGFAYLGRQFLLNVGNGYRTDLLFYHTKIKSYVIIELKMRDFEPEFIGKLNFYVNVINSLVKDESDKPTIGILLCKNKNNYVVDFSLSTVSNPIGVSTFHYTELSEDIKAALPSAEMLQNELINFEQRYGNK